MEEGGRRFGLRTPPSSASHYLFDRCKAGIIKSFLKKFLEPRNLSGRG
ncbi:hypothetical protein HMPREF0239_02965 [Clostridium sp. ATCC BAA-442]|nr:hypothetical protein HMPREF0239_02965 [Clostridium sp. ATCC BAA-442]